MQIDGNRVLCHRIINITDKGEFITKGDANKQDDRWLMPPGQLGFKKEQLLGKVWNGIPYLGLPVLVIWEYHWCKVLLMAGLFLAWWACLYFVDNT